jgi:hypothetical protein
VERIDTGDPQELRRKKYTLTSKGRKLMTEIGSAIEA